MSEVARAADVSVTTELHVINRTLVVCPDTERAVLAAVAQLVYVPEDTARSLPQVGRARSASPCRHLERLLRRGRVRHRGRGRRARFTILLADTHDRTTDEIRAVADFLERGRPGHGRPELRSVPSSLNRHGAKCRGWCAAPAETTPS